LLLELLRKSADAKSIFTASALHQGNVDFANLEYKTNFSGLRAYCQSKLEVILICRLLAKKLEEQNIGVYCQHPGFVNTKLGRDAGWFSNFFFRTLGISPEKGAETLIYLADENKSQLVSGEYYYKKAVKKTTSQSNNMLVAKKLLNTLKTYLNPYLKSPSAVFEFAELSQV
jgi:NAD(P)-dependent dehydrogenase (short-subunit alcohol dehydrogenase family)